MKRTIALLASIAILSLSGCAQLAAVTVPDFKAAGDNYRAAAAVQPVGSPLAGQFASDALCMDAALAKIQADLGTDTKAQIVGLISTGSVLHIQVSEWQARLASGGTAIPAPCLQLIGEVVVNAGGITGRAYRHVPWNDGFGR